MSLSWQKGKSKETRFPVDSKFSFQPTHSIHLKMIWLIECYKTNVDIADAYLILTLTGHSFCSVPTPALKTACLHFCLSFASRHRDLNPLDPDQYAWARHGKLGPGHRPGEQVNIYVTCSQGNWEKTAQIKILLCLKSLSLLAYRAQR